MQADKPNTVQSFNPSFGGFISKTLEIQETGAFQFGFNPSFGGFISKTSGIVIGESPIAPFQSFVWWIYL